MHYSSTRINTNAPVLVQVPAPTAEIHLMFILVITPGIWSNRESRELWARSCHIIMDAWHQVRWKGHKAILLSSRATEQLVELVLRNLFIRFALRYGKL